MPVLGTRAHSLPTWECKISRHGFRSGTAFINPRIASNESKVGVHRSATRRKSHRRRRTSGVARLGRSDLTVFSNSRMFVAKDNRAGAGGPNEQLRDRSPLRRVAGVGEPRFAMCALKRPRGKSSSRWEWRLTSEVANSHYRPTAPTRRSRRQRPLDGAVNLYHSFANDKSV